MLVASCTINVFNVGGLFILFILATEDYCKVLRQYIAK